MVVREDGTKWACQSCLKGHRVSGCTHLGMSPSLCVAVVPILIVTVITDRELVLVPKKGRPVTQCQHCRQERKKRSAHVKCDCSETDKPHHSKEKCIHLREAEEKAKAGGYRDDHHEEQDPHYLAAVKEEQGCCCPHGGKCACALLKTDDDRDGSPPHGKPAVQKPYLESRKSEGCITVFANGHHKPVHRKNHAAHESGMPYKMPVSRTQSDNVVSRPARRSVDNLTLNTLDSNASTSVPSTFQGTHHRRMSKSEQASPKLSGVRPANFGNFATLDFANMDQLQTDATMTSALSDAPAFSMADPTSSIADSSFDPWGFPSADFNALPNNNPFEVWPTTTDVHGLAQPALTAASSGTQSEIDDIPGMEDFYGPGMPSIQEDVGNFDFGGLDTNNATQSNRRSLPPNFFGNTNFGMPIGNDEWQTQIGTLDNVSDKSKGSDMIAGEMDMVDNMWQLPNFHAVTDAQNRQLGGLSQVSSTRHTQRNTASDATRNDTLRSLFPGMDFDNGNFDLDTTQAPSDSTKASAFPDNVDNASGIDFDNYGGEDNGFTSQSWTDGSMSIPNDPFNSYDFTQDISNQDYSPNWTQ